MIRTTVKLSLFLLFLIYFSFTAFGDSASVEKPARILPPPNIISADDGSFRFAVFGDTRTGEVFESSLKNVLYGAKRFTEADIDDEEDKEFVIYRNHLFDNIASNFTTKSGKNKKGMFDFALFTGDFPRQGTKAHWMEIQKGFLDKIPLEDGSPGRIYPAIGNHELWSGPYNEETYGIKNATKGALEVYFDTFPYLAGDTGKLALDGGKEQAGLHNYAFFVDQSVFVTLCTGNVIFDACFPDNGDRIFLCEQSTFGEQMAWFEEVLEYGINAKDTKNVFVQYHKPSYSTYKHKPLNQCCDPINVMSEYKSQFPNLNMFVFNGHNHTTELYRTDDGITVLVAGGGGAPQDESKANKDWSEFKDTPKELFWNSLKPYINKWQKRISYYVVTVNGADVELTEMCLTNKGGFPRFEEGIRITKDGEIESPGYETGVLE
ncbi:metallophosphoesterase [bacterium]|nr:metallophosphoesterase [bacterium]